MTNFEQYCQNEKNLFLFYTISSVFRLNLCVFTFHLWHYMLKFSHFLLQYGNYYDNSIINLPMAISIQWYLAMPNYYSYLDFSKKSISTLWYSFIVDLCSIKCMDQLSFNGLIGPIKPIADKVKYIAPLKEHWYLENFLKLNEAAQI